MSDNSVQRRLAAILAADVAGYTRLMAEDEESTLAAWWSARNDVIDPMIAAHGGRIVKHTGDGFLAEFSTATEAVRCAVEMQNALAAGNEKRSDDKRFDFRMGVNIGEIVDDAEDIYGDGVNIAARLESLADPGGICISAAVRQQIKNRLELELEDLGSKKVKHVTEPLRHYRIRLASSPDLSRVRAVRAAKQVSRIRRIFSPLRIVAAALVIVVAAAMLLPGGEAPVRRTGEAPIISIAPFKTIGKVSGNDEFSIGLTDDLLTALSSTTKFRVFRNDAGTDAKSRSSLKAASYRFEGSVRQIGGIVRVSAQLVDPNTGFHLWGGRYDRKLGDVLAIQTEVAGKIVATLSDRLAEAEMEKTEAETTLAGGVGDALFRGLTSLGQLAERAAFLPQDLMNWMSGNDHMGMSVKLEGRRSFLRTRQKDFQEWT